MRRSLVLLVTALAATLATLTTGVVSANATLPHTERVVIRPVHANGTPVAGYTVRSQTIQGFTCDGEASPGAVDRNIEYCGFSATYTVACWKSANHTVLCLRNPAVKELVRIRYQGTFTPTPAPRHPSPQAVTLFDRDYCLIRGGGAWPMVKGHPNWYGHYSCSHTGLYGPGRDGIDRSVNPWRVHDVRNPNGGPGWMVNRRVKLAWYVGTAS